MPQETLSYKDSFLKNVNGKLYAKFSTQGNGDPTYKVIAIDGKEHRYYTIQLFLASPNKDSIQLVEYCINHPDFEDDPLSLSDDPEHDFRQYIMSYGDVWVDVKVYMNGRGYSQRAMLSQMLDVGHADHTSETIVDAIARIKAN